MAIRKAFVERFGKDAARAVERAAEGHENGVNSARKGADPFKWALLIAIGYDCMENPSYRDYHDIAPPWADLKAWIIAEARLGTHDGDADYLSLMTGRYNEFVGKPEPA